MNIQKTEENLLFSSSINYGCQLFTSCLLGFVIFATLLYLKYREKQKLKTDIVKTFCLLYRFI